MSTRDVFLYSTYLRFRHNILKIMNLKKKVIEENYILQYESEIGQHLFEG